MAVDHAEMDVHAGQRRYDASIAAVIVAEVRSGTETEADDLASQDRPGSVLHARAQGAYPRADEAHHEGPSMTSEHHAAIYADLPDDLVRRMRNWVRGRDGTPVMSSSAVYDFIDNKRYESKIPTMYGEAQDTEIALRRLPERYRECVETFWLYERQSLTWMSTATARLRLWKVGRVTFRNWLNVGHELLKIELAKQREAYAQRRQLSEMQIDSARNEP